MRIGFTELLVVFFVALVVLGPDKLPGYARKLGEALSAFRKASDEATREIRENIVEPLEEAQKPLREAMEPLEELDKTVRGNVREVQSSLRDVGKGKPPARKASDSGAASHHTDGGETSPKTDNREPTNHTDSRDSSPKTDSGKTMAQGAETMETPQNVETMETAQSAEPVRESGGGKTEGAQIPGNQPAAEHKAMENQSI